MLALSEILGARCAGCGRKDLTVVGQSVHCPHCNASVAMLGARVKFSELETGTHFWDVGLMMLFRKVGAGEAAVVGPLPKGIVAGYVGEPVAPALIDMEEDALVVPEGMRLFAGVFSLN